MGLPYNDRVGGMRRSEIGRKSTKVSSCTREKGNTASWEGESGVLPNGAPCETKWGKTTESAGVPSVCGGGVGGVYFPKRVRKDGVWTKTVVLVKALRNWCSSDITEFQGSS